MSHDASIEFVWGEGPTRFAMRIGELRDLEGKRKAGAIEILRRFELETWYVDDVREVLRVGLIGGGKTPSEAHRLTSRYVDELPVIENYIPAYAVLAAGLRGNPDDTAGKPTAAEAVREPETTDSLSPLTSDGEPS